MTPCRSDPMKQIGETGATKNEDASSTKAGDEVKHCASCNKSSTTLKKCTACKTVWYCNVSCQKNHRKAHKKECKRIELELKSGADNKFKSGGGNDAGESETKTDDDPELWKPHPPNEDCPVCMVPLPHEFIASHQCAYLTCCSKTLCHACIEEHTRVWRITNKKRKKKELPPIDPTCPFCRTPAHKGDAEYLNRLEAHVQKGSISAIMNMAVDYKLGSSGLPRSEAKSLELFRRAADLGDADAICEIGRRHESGEGGFLKNVDEGRQHMKTAAMMGSVMARHNLACLEASERNYDLTVKHFRLAAEAGVELSVQNLWKYFNGGKLSKEELEETLRLHKEACEGMDSEERKRISAYHDAEAGDDDVLQRIYRSYYGGTINAKGLKKALAIQRDGQWNMKELKKVMNDKAHRAV